MMSTADPVGEIDPVEAQALAAQGALLLDVREPDEWAAGHIPGAVHLPLAAVEPSAVPTDRVVVAVCRSGRRSGEAARLLAAAGRDMRNLAGGMQAWATQGGAVVRDDGAPGGVA